MGKISQAELDQQYNFLDPNRTVTKQRMGAITPDEYIEDSRSHSPLYTALEWKGLRKTRMNKQDFDYFKFIETEGWDEWVKRLKGIDHGKA